MLNTGIELGIVPTHVKFVGGLIPDENGNLPRDEGGEFVVIAEMKSLLQISKVKIIAMQLPYFAGTNSEDLEQIHSRLQEIGLKMYLILMVGGVDPMNPADEDAVVAQLVEGLQVAKKYGVSDVASTSVEEWMQGADRKEGEDFEEAIRQLVKVHKRALIEAEVEGSAIKAWHIEFLRDIEFSTFTDLGRIWKFIRAMNDELGKPFFKTLVDTAHCGDSELGISENRELIAEIAKSDELGIFHASAKTTRGCLSGDEGYIATLLESYANAGKLKQVFVEIFHHEDEALAALRDAVAGHGVDTTNGRSYTQVVTDGLESVAGYIDSF